MFLIFSKNNTYANLVPFLPEFIKIVCVSVCV